MKRTLTLASIEADGAKRTASVIESLRGCYVETYGIRNPWTAWLIRQNSRLAELKSADICGWQSDGDWLDDESDWEKR